MTDLEIKAAAALINCNFLPGTYDKKFVHQLGNWYDRKMTEKGREMMIKLVQKYRRQIAGAENLVNDLIATTPYTHENTNL